VDGLTGDVFVQTPSRIQQQIQQDMAKGFFVIFLIIVVIVLIFAVLSSSSN
jgi:hypothetical protein